MRRRTLYRLATTIIFLASPVVAGLIGTDVVVPLVGYNRIATPNSRKVPVTLWLTNHSTTAYALISVQLYADGATTNPIATTKLELGPGETTTISDPLGSLFGLTTADGALRFISKTEVLVAIHADADESGSTEATGAGAGFEGIPASCAIALGQDTTLLGVAETSTFDYRFAAVETAGQAVTFNVTLKDDAGAVVASRRYDLPPCGALERSVADLSPLPFSLPSGRLEVVVSTGEGSVLAYGMRTSKLSKNAAGFEMALVAPTADNVSGATPGDVLNGLTFWSLRTDGSGGSIWGPSVGSMLTRTVDPSTVAQQAGFYDAFDLSAVDPDLNAGNIRSGATVFGLSGTWDGPNRVVSSHSWARPGNFVYLTATCPSGWTRSNWVCGPSGGSVQDADITVDLQAYIGPQKCTCIVWNNEAYGLWVALVMVCN